MEAASEGDGGADRIGVYLTDAGMTVRRNGAAVDAATTAGPVQVQADGSITITWPDGSRLQVLPIGAWGLALSTQLAPARRGQVTGLLGDFNGSSAGDLVVRGGAPVAQPPSFASLYPTFADSWRIAQQDSLFDYGQGESTATFTHRSFPSQATAANPADSAAARAVCKAAGVTDPVSRQNCILDVALSGQAIFADAAAATQSVPNGPADGGGTVLTVAPGGTASMTIQGTAGQKVFIDVSSSKLPDECGVITLRAPDGKTLGSGCVINGAGFIDGTTLAATGTYTIVADPSDRRVGTALV